MRTWLFDIDGTLINSGGAGEAAMRVAVSSCFATPVDTSRIQFAGRTDRSILVDLFAEHQIEPSEQNVRRFCEAYFQHLPRSLTARQGEVLRGVRDWLARIAAQDHDLLGLLTGNFARGAEHKLKHFGLWEYFRFGGFGDQHLHRNDVAKEAFIKAEHIAGRPLEPLRTWVIGDTPRDIECARAIGVRVIAVATGIYSRDELAAYEPDLLLADLSNVQVLQELLDAEP